MRAPRQAHHAPLSVGAAARARGAAAEGPGSHVLACSTLAGDAVWNRRGEELGVLKHLMLDVTSGRIAYAVLSRGGVLGIGARLHAIPWSALSFDAERKYLVLDVERERLARAPAFDPDHWPAMADRAWARAVHEFYEGRGRAGLQ